MLSKEKVSHEGNEILDNLKLKDEEEAEEGTAWEKLKNAIKQTWWLGLNIMLVLLFEGTVNTGTVFVSVETEVAETSDYFFIKNYFEGFLSPLQLPAGCFSSAQPWSWVLPHRGPE